MKKNFTLILLALLPMVAGAYDAKIDGIYYNFSGDEATVTYQKHQNSSPYYISDYSGSVVIPESVTYNGKTYSVTSIGGSAFEYCSSLTSITIPNSVTSINEGAFEYCSGLTSITIPNSVTYIGDDAFAGCTGLTAVHISDLEAWCNIYYDGPYGSCTNPLLYANHLFLNGVEVKNLVIPSSLTHIGKYTFSGCKGLTSITIPSSVTSIGNSAFYNCTGLTSVIIPNSVTWIGWDAFCGCSGLTSISIPNSVTSIGWGAFWGCSGLTSISIPNSVNYIGDNAFYKCTGLRDVYCYATEPPIAYEENENSSYSSFDISFIKENTTLHVPAGSVDAYSTTAPWSNFGTIVPMEKGVAYIDGIYYDLSENEAKVINKDYPHYYSISDDYFGVVVIPENVTYNSKTYRVTGIAGAFLGCTGLTSITIPSSVEDILEGSFANCSNLKEIIVEKGNSTYDSRNDCNAIIKTSDNMLFAGCKNTIIPNSVTKIGNFAFYGCTNLTSVTIPNSVTQMGSLIFDSCSNLTDVYCYAEEVPSTNSYAFNNSPIASATLHVPESAIEQYRTTEPWSNFGVIQSLITYTITYIVDGEVYESYDVYYNTPITPEPAPTKEGYTFSGWSYIPAMMPATDVIVMGAFTINQYLLTYILDGEEYKSYEIDYNTALTPEPVPVKKGMTFSGWGEVPETMPAHDLTLTGSYSWSKETVDGVIYQVTDTLSNYASVIGTESMIEEATILPYVEIGGDVYEVYSIADNALPKTVTIYVPVGKLLMWLWTNGYEDIRETESGRSLAAPEVSLVAATASSLTLSYVNQYPEFSETVMLSGSPIEKGENGYEVTLKGLEPNNLYEELVSLTLTYDDATYTKAFSFSTSPLTLTTQQPKVVSLGNVVVAADSNLDDGETNVGFEWRRTDWTEDFASSTGAAYLYEGTMEGFIRNLNTDKLWKYRPYYKSNAGNSYYGDWVGIDPTNISYFQPTVHTYSTINLIGNLAEIWGYVMRGTDNISSQGFIYWNISFSSSRRNANGIPSDAKTILASGNVMTATLENLDYDTEYCYLAFVTTSEGETFYGEPQTFRTGEGDPDGIKDIDNSPLNIDHSWYDLSGRKIDKPQKGINIIRYSDGTSKKVLVK